MKGEMVEMGELDSLVPRLSYVHGREEGKKESLVHSDRKFHHVRLLPLSALSHYDA